MDDMGTRSIPKGVLRAALLAEAVYALHPAGGYAHLVIEDWNVDDEDVQYCLQVCGQNPDKLTLEELGPISAFLLQMNVLDEDERLQALRLHAGCSMA